MKRNIFAAIVTFCFILSFSVKVNATEYSNFVYGNNLSLQVYDGEGKVTLTVVEKNKEKVYELVKDTIKGDHGGFSKDGTIYLLFKDGTLWYLNWKVQKKPEISILDQDVIRLTRSDYGWVTGWEKKSGTKKVLSKDKLEKRLDKKRIVCKKSHKYYLINSKGETIDKFSFKNNKITYHKKTYKEVKKIKFKKGRLVAVKKNKKTVKVTQKKYVWKINQ